MKEPATSKNQKLSKTNKAILIFGIIAVLFLPLFIIATIILSSYLFIQTYCFYGATKFNTSESKYVKQYLGFTVQDSRPTIIGKSANDACLVAPGGELYAQYNIPPTNFGVVNEEVHKYIRLNNKLNEVSQCGQYNVKNHEIKAMNYLESGDGIGKNKDIYYMIRYIPKDQNIDAQTLSKYGCDSVSEPKNVLIDKVLISVTNIPIK